MNENLMNESPLSLYKKNFPSFWEDEKYKWEAVQRFQEKWDIEAEDFGAMIADATEKHGNLLVSQKYYPIGMIQEFVKVDKERTRNMYRTLFDENKELGQRISFFITEAEALRKTHDSEWGNHYQDLRAISVYLMSRYPEKYYIYKYTELKNTIEFLGDDFSFKSKKDSGLFYASCVQYLNGICARLSADEELQAMMHERLDHNINLYKDEARHITTTDFVFYVGKRLKQKLNDVIGEANGRQVDSSNKAYWIYSPGENASKWQECQDKNIMCIGWDELGDLSEYNSREDMRIEIRNSYSTEGSAVNDSLAVWQFSREMKEGDIVFAKKGLSKIIGRGVVESDYIYDGSRSEYMHVRKVKWTHIGEWETAEKNAMKTLTNITKYKDYIESLNNLIERKEPKIKSTGKQYWWLTGSPKYWSPSTDWELGDDIDYTLYNEKGNKRRVFKHFTEAKPDDIVIAYEATPVLQIVAIGRVVSETDGEVLYIRKMEELLSPVPYSEILTNPILKDSEPVMNRCQGSLFKLTQDEYDEIMRLIRKDNPEPVVDDEEDIEEFAPYWDEDFLKEVYMNKKDYERLKELLLRKKNLILQGAPGVGKTFAAKRLAYAIMGEKNDKRVKIVQFHQNYSYEDFVLGYKPNENGGFDLKEGIFYQFCRKAAADKDNEYFFIIDEINRGNLSKIFGELLMMIEKDYRDTPIQLSYADRRFAVPSNVYLIGMMNTADRSLAMIDYALRRRFSFYEMKPAFENSGFINYKEKKHDPQLNKLVDALKNLNKVIAEDDSLGTGFCIGHSYLCDLGDDYDLESIVEYDIIPMLREYWFDNNERFEKEAQRLRESIK